MKYATKTEIKTVLALILYMGVNKKNGFRDYWTSSIIFNK